MRFEVTDENLLKLSAVAQAAVGLSAFVVPRQTHDTLYEKTATYSEPNTRNFGAALSTAAAQTFAVSASDFSRDAKKNLLKVNGTSWLVFAAQGVYNAQDDILRKDLAYTHAALATGLGAWCLWRGFAEEDTKTVREI